MKCDFCRVEDTINTEGQLTGFVIESNGRRPLCLRCAKRIWMAVSQRLLDTVFGCA